MKRSIALSLVCLIAGSLTLSATVHAREVPGGATMDCSGYVHSDNDADHSQGDADQGDDGGAEHLARVHLHAVEHLTRLLPDLQLMGIFHAAGPFPCRELSRLTAES